MAIITASIAYGSKNFYKDITPIQSDVFNLVLPSDKVYDIGLDQSSSCSGIAIRSIDDDLTVIIDCRNDSFNKDTYYRELKGVLHKLVHDRKIRLIICEDPPPVKDKRYASTVLLELRGRVSQWIEMIPELNNAAFKSIYPQTWKSLIVDKRKSKNRGKDKKLIAEDICDIVPAFNRYRLTLAPKDYDSFDSLGILLGYRKYAYTEDGLPLICGKIEKRHTSFVGYRYVPINDVIDKKVNDYLGVWVDLLKPVFLTYNERYSKFENIRMATSNWRCSYTVAPDSFLDTLKWKYDLEKKDGYVLLAYMYNFSHFTASERKAIKQVYEYLEEDIVTC